MVDFEDFSENLKELRLLRNLTQVQLEKLSGIPQPMISSYETGKSVPCKRILEKLLQALDAELEAEKIIRQSWIEAKI